MTPLDLILLLIVALFVVYLAIVAASEPRYTWYDVHLDKLLGDMQRSVDELSRKIGEQLIPIFKRATDAMLEFSEAMSRINHDQP